MDKRLWSNINWFEPEENWGDKDLLQFELVQKLDWLREAAGVEIHINCAADLSGHSPNSYHYKGMAADIHAVGMAAGDLFLLATSWFTGIGVYPYWNTPGLHVDIRQLEMDEASKYWISWRKGKYHKLDIRELAMCHCKTLRHHCLMLNGNDDVTDPAIPI